MLRDAERQFNAVPAVPCQTLSGANVFAISDIQEDETQVPVNQSLGKS
jgi:hypothetical protein